VLAALGLDKRDLFDLDAVQFAARYGRRRTR